MKKLGLILACMMMGTLAFAEAITVTGTLKINDAGKYYSITGTTPQIAKPFSVAKGQLEKIDITPFSDGDKVTVTFEAAGNRSDGKINHGVISSIEKAQ